MSVNLGPTFGFKITADECLKNSRIAADRRQEVRETEMRNFVEYCEASIRKAVDEGEKSLSISLCEKVEFPNVEHYIAKVAELAKLAGFRVNWQRGEMIIIYFSWS